MTEQIIKGRRRYNPMVKRVVSGGDYDEWFEIRTKPTLADFLEASRAGETELEQGVALASRLIKRWSISTLEPLNPAHDPLAAGEDLSDEEIEQMYRRVPEPITQDAIMTLPLDMVMPLLEEMQSLANFQKAA
jgi:hypothetical protein